MSSITRLILGVLLVLLIAAAGVGGYLYHLWYTSDEVLRELVLEKLQEIGPEWDVSIKRARPDLQGRIHIYDVQLREADGRNPLVEIAEVVLTVDGLAEPDPTLQRVTLVRPQVRLARAADGVWNFQRLPPPKLQGAAIPEIRCEDVELSFDLAAGAGGPTHVLLHDGDLHLVPSGKRQFRIQARARWDQADEFSLTGRWNIDAPAWQLDGQLRNLRLDDALLQALAKHSSDLQRGLLDLKARLSGLTKDDAPDSRDLTVALGLVAAADVQFQVDRQSAGDWTYQAQVSWLGGEFRPAGWPYPLQGLRGHVTCDPAEIKLTKLAAHSGGTRIAIDEGRLVRSEQQWRPEKFDVAIFELALDDRLFGLLPAEMRRVRAMIQPTGAVDLQLYLSRDERHGWSRAGQMTLRDCSAAHVNFPYRVDRIKGDVVCAEGIIKLELTGRAGSRPVTLRGKIGDRGAESPIVALVDTAGLPIDRKFYNACSDKFREVIDYLALQGEIDGTLLLQREAGPNQPLTWKVLRGRLHDGSVLCREFPYALSDVVAEFNGTGDRWKIPKFTGRHGDAQLDVSDANWRPDETGVARLDFGFQADRVPLDGALFAALPADWRENWEEFNPSGWVNVRDGTLEWRPKTRPELRFDADLYDSRLHVRSFPYALDEVQAKLHIGPERVDITSFVARHDETVFRAEGRATMTDEGEWRLRLTDIHVDDLEATRALRKALPDGIKNVIEVCNPRGKVSLKGEIEFRGRRNDDCPVTAAWKTTTIYTNNTLTAGVDLKKVRGTANFRGEWNGETVEGIGTLDLGSVEILGYQFADVSGPVTIRGNKMTIGDPDGDGRGNQAKRLTARFIGGQVRLDADINLEDPMRYAALLTLEKGDLREYAKLYMPNSRNLAGVTNGWVNLNGKGTDPKQLEGNGRLVISPAALYELPVIVAVFNALSNPLSPPHNTAFDHAEFHFDIDNSIVQFQRIDLVGEALSLVGRGSVNFDGRVGLDFYSRGGRKQLFIPFVRELANMASTGWVGVNVRGTVREPVPEMHPLPQLDQSLKRFLGVFDSRGPTRR
ncbi:MAG: hypothetical protein ACT4QC_19090 [Planctomycetaceae bacterium]